MSMERRRHPRAPLPRVPGHEEPSLADLSVSGLFIRTRSPWAVGHAISLDLQPMGEGPPIPVRGRVVRVIDGPQAVLTGRAGMAVEFDPIVAESVERLQALVHEHVVAWERRTGRKGESKEGSARPAEPSEDLPEDLPALRALVLELKRRLAEASAEIERLREGSHLPPAIEVPSTPAEKESQTTVKVKVVRDRLGEPGPTADPPPAAAIENPAKEGFATQFLSLTERRAVGLAPAAAGGSAPSSGLAKRRRRPATTGPANGNHAPKGAFGREEFVSLLRQGQSLVPTPLFFRQTPVHAEEAFVGSLVEQGGGLEGLRGHLAGRISEGQLIEILFGFYRRGLVDFD